MSTPSSLSSVEVRIGAAAGIVGSDRSEHIAVAVVVPDLEAPPSSSLID
jgi:hypothetical protein